MSAVAHSGVRWRGSIITSWKASVHGSDCLCTTLACVPTRAHYRSFAEPEPCPMHGYPLQPEVPLWPSSGTLAQDIMCVGCTLTHTLSRIVATSRMVLVSPCNSGTSMGTPTEISLRSIRLACRIQRWQWVAMGQRWKWNWPMFSTRAGAHADALRRGNQRDIEAAQRVSGPHSTEH